MAAFTVDDVVNRAGLAKGSFYTYFESRDAYLDELRYALSEDIGEAAEQAAAGSWQGLLGRLMRASVQWQLDNREVLGLFGVSYMANPTRSTRAPLLLVVERLLAAGQDARVLRPLGCENAEEEGPGATAAIVLDVISEACARAVASHPEETPISAAEEFLERALLFDRRRAEAAVYEPPGA